MLMRKHYCPMCGDPSDYLAISLKLSKKSLTPVKEDLHCERCGWQGTWKEMNLLEGDPNV